MTLFRPLILTTALAGLALPTLAQQLVPAQSEIGRAHV